MSILKFIGHFYYYFSVAPHLHIIPPVNGNVHEAVNGVKCKFYSYFAVLQCIMLEIFKCIREKGAIKTQCVVYMGMVDVGVGGGGVGKGNTAKVTVFGV